MMDPIDFETILFIKIKIYETSISSLDVLNLSKLQKVYYPSTKAVIHWFLSSDIQKGIVVSIFV